MKNFDFLFHINQPTTTNSNISTFLSFFLSSFYYVYILPLKNP